MEYHSISRNRNILEPRKSICRIMKMQSYLTWWDELIWLFLNHCVNSPSKCHSILSRQCNLNFAMVYGRMDGECALTFLLYIYPPSISVAVHKIFGLLEVLVLADARIIANKSKWSIITIMKWVLDSNSQTVPPEQKPDQLKHVGLDHRSNCTIPPHGIDSVLADMYILIKRISTYYNSVLRMVLPLRYWQICICWLNAYLLIVVQSSTWSCLCATGRYVYADYTHIY